MKNNKMERTAQVCPKCGKEYTGYPALSRVDNRTEICPECGIRESLKILNISDDEIEQIVNKIKNANENN